MLSTRVASPLQPLDVFPSATTATSATPYHSRPTRPPPLKHSFPEPQNEIKGNVLMFVLAASLRMRKYFLLMSIGFLMRRSKR